MTSYRGLNSKDVVLYMSGKEREEEVSNFSVDRIRNCTEALRTDCVPSFTRESCR